MAAATIFVSYSQQDREALEQLKKFVWPLEREGLIDYWYDRRIEAGRDWEADILAALERARVVVLLISQDFLASEYIYRQEISRILARAHDDGLIVIPVFLSPSTAADQDFSFDDAQGQQRHDTLTRFQGVGKPDNPLSDCTWSDRERLFAARSPEPSTA